MPTPPKRTKEAEQSPFTMDDIARRFLSTAPAPKPPKAKPTAKPTARKTNKPAK